MASLIPYSYLGILEFICKFLVFWAQELLCWLRQQNLNLRREGKSKSLRNNAYTYKKKSNSNKDDEVVKRTTHHM